MTYVDAIKRAAVTFVAAAVASPIGSVVLDMAWWKAAALGGMTAVVNLVGRLSQGWLKAHPEIGN